MLKLDGSYDLGKGTILLAFEDAFCAAKSLLDNKETKEDHIVFRGDLLSLFEKAETFAIEVENQMYKDYYYNSLGFPVASRSIQSAIWVIEDKCGTPNKFNYFIILKMIK